MNPILPRALLALLPLLALLASGCTTMSLETTEYQTAAYFETIRDQPKPLARFVRAMPKGGDLHNHLSGAIYAESYIQWAAEDGLCVEVTRMTLVAPTATASCDAEAGRPPASLALTTPWLYNALIDAWSMRNWTPASGVSGHDHFFATFGKFGAASATNTGKMLAEAASRAAAEELMYLELMLTPDSGISRNLGRATGWDDDLARLRGKLLDRGILTAAKAVTTNLDEMEAELRDQLACGTPAARPGCDVTLRYQFQVSRGTPKEQVFAQMVAACEAARRDPRLVALNLVQPEDGPTAVADFSLQMKMLDYLHGVYPGVHIALHAGELVPGLAPPEALTFHIRDSIEVGHAERIGHGVDVMDEERPVDLMREMARRRILVEICLSSNDAVLGVRGARHPLRQYQRHGVPVALATDDAGVLRSSITEEYLKGIREQQLNYRELKTMARASLEHAFLTGPSLWRDLNQAQPTAACGSDGVGRLPPSDPCRQFLADSPKARLQWELEEALTAFESDLARDDARLIPAAAHPEPAWAY